MITTDWVVLNMREAMDIWCSGTSVIFHRELMVYEIISKLRSERHCRQEMWGNKTRGIKPSAPTLKYTIFRTGANFPGEILATLYGVFCL